MNRYEAAKQGHAHVLLLAGEPGIGKMRLLDEIAVRTAQQGAVVLRGGASEAEGMPPYLPFLEALGRYIQEAPLDRLREEVAAASPVLISILPELIVRLGELATPHPLPPEQARFRLYEAVGNFLQSIAALGRYSQPRSGMSSGTPSVVCPYAAGRGVPRQRTGGQCRAYTHHR